MTNWTNSDGLEVKFGLDEAKQGKVSSSNELEQHISVVLDAADMVIGGGRVDSDNPVLIPANSYITRAIFRVITGFDSAGDAATLDLGLGLADGTYTGGDEDGIDVAIAEAAIATDGLAVACNGALVNGTAVSGAVDLYPTYDVDTEVFTAGKGVLHIFFIPPAVGA